jgi:hypothetical protein
MGGAIASRLAPHLFKYRSEEAEGGELKTRRRFELSALVVVDVVEGTAMSALDGMTAILRARPQRFRSTHEAVEWR